MKWLWTLLVCALLACCSACASAQARTEAAVPLEIPNPPPRASIDPAPLSEPPQPAQLEPAQPAQPERPATRPASADGGRQNRPAPAPAPAPAAAAAPVAGPVTPPAAELRAEPGSGAPSATQVREILTRAREKLDAIDRARLSAGKQTDYDTARRFAAQAEAAIRENNLLLARYSAEKAEALASGLR